MLRHKWPSAKIIIYACLVQGDKASKEIIECVNQANIRDEVNTLIIARGGGSFEDLNPFNDENLVRAVFNSKIPIILVLDTNLTQLWLIMWLIYMHLLQH